jgi:hypothetical protein
MLNIYMFGIKLTSEPVSSPILLAIGLPKLLIFFCRWFLNKNQLIALPD